MFDGTMEVRTPSRTTRVRAGEVAHVDDEGCTTSSRSHDTADDFERWFLQRAARTTAAQQPLPRPIARLLRSRPRIDGSVGLRRRLRRLVLAPARRCRLASVLQRLLAPQPRRRARVGLVRSVGLGPLPLRPLGYEPASGGCGCPAPRTRRRGSTGCTARATSAGRRPAGTTATVRTTTGPIARTRAPASSSAAASTGACARTTSTLGPGRS